MKTDKLIEDKSTIQPSHWAKFCLSVAGYRFFEGNKMVSKHKLFTIASGYFNFNNFSPTNNDEKLRDYLQTKFKMQDAEGWKDGRYRFSWVRDNYGVLSKSEME